MSVLSTVTSSLPNVLNLLQGKWDVQYKVGKPASTPMNWLESARSVVQSAITYLNGLPSQDDGYEWKSLDFDSFVDINEVEDTSIVNHHIEGGSFRSVNKVRKPKMIKVTLAKAGIGYGIEDSLAEVKKLLPLARYSNKESKRYGLSQAAEDAADWLLSNIFRITKTKVKDTSIPMEFRIVTPFDMIKKMNLIKLDYTFKKDNGRNMLLMYLTFQEILEKSAKTKGNIKQPTNADGENVGRLSAQSSSGFVNMDMIRGFNNSFIGRGG